jgi:hypothetical protein
MVKLHQIQSFNASLAKRQPLIAVFFGGTGGIGNITLRSLVRVSAQNSGSTQGLKIFIVGRNTVAAEETIKDCERNFPGGEYVYVQAGDMSLIGEVGRLCKEVGRLVGESCGKEGWEPRIDYMMVSMGGMIFQPRNGMSLLVFVVQ